MKNQKCDELSYDLFVMRRMLEQLPSGVRDNCLSQLNKIENAAKDQNRRISKVAKEVIARLDDVKLDIKAHDFDLQATRQERDNLQQLLDDLT